MLKMRVLSTGCGPGTADCSTHCRGTVPRTNSRNLHTQMCHDHDMAVLHIHAVRLTKVKFPHILENLKGIEGQVSCEDRKRENPFKISFLPLYNRGVHSLRTRMCLHSFHSHTRSTHVLGRFIQAPYFTILKVFWHGIG
jgi:hypothetical protein